MKYIQNYLIILLCIVWGCKDSPKPSSHISTTGWGRSAKINAYINQYKDLAILERDSTGVPASVQMAQAILESNAGKSSLARRQNNHFGVKCFGKDCNGTYKSYKNVKASWDDHSRILEAQRYRILLNYTSTDYHSWAKGLQECGYATDRKYTKKLIEMIEDYQLYKLDE